MRNEQRMEALKNAGVNTNMYMSFVTSSGKSVEIDGTDAIVINGKRISLDEIGNGIVKRGYVENTLDYRRFIMAQMFHMMKAEGGYNAAFRRLPYWYQFEYLVKEYNVLSHLEKENDREAYEERSRFFTKDVVRCTLGNLLENIQKYANLYSTVDRNGNHIVKFHHFGTYDMEREHHLEELIHGAISTVENADSATQIYTTLRTLFPCVPKRLGHKEYWVDPKKSNAFASAFKGAGSYYTLMNMVKYHGIKLYNYDTDSLITDRTEAVRYLRNKLFDWDMSDEGYKFYAMLNKTIEMNGRMW